MTLTAPYNFVRLPRAVLSVDGGLPLPDGSRSELWKHQDELVPGTLTGWIDVDFQTLSPLFTRSPDDEREPHLDERGCPLVPGSSVRGALRSLVEIVAFAKPQPVHDGQLVFRDLRKEDPEGKEFLARMRDRPVEGGFIRRRADGTYEIQPTERGRVSWGALQAALTTDVLRACGVASGAHAVRDGENIDTRAAYHMCGVWVVGPTPGSDEFVLVAPGAGGSRRAVLVVTGPMEGKGGEHVFLLGSRSAIPIPDDVWKTFHSRGQVSQFQQLQYRTGTRRPGHLMEGDPVFFQRRDKQDAPGEFEVAFLGRSQMYRQPYETTPADLVPAALRRDCLDLAEALFGRVGGDTEPTTVRGRVRFRDARWAGDEQDLPGVLYPEHYDVLLSSPKPTMAPFYLRVDRARAPDRRASDLKASYLRSAHPGTEVRGHKLYWHRRDVDLDGAWHPSGAQTSTLRPVRENQPFTTRIDFDGLAPIELGALLTALNLPVGCAHHLGGGQPLGLGSVEVTATRVHVVDRERRYGSHAASGSYRWRATSLRAATDGEILGWRRAFEDVICEHALAEGEPGAATDAGLWDLHRMRELMVLLRMGGPADPKRTAQMLRPEDFTARTPLLTPHAVADPNEPKPSFEPTVPRPRPPRRPRSEHPKVGDDVRARAKGGESEGQYKPLLVIIVDGVATRYDTCTLADDAVLPSPGQCGEYTVTFGGSQPQLGPRRA